MKSLQSNPYYALFLIICVLLFGCNGAREQQPPSNITQSEIRLTEDGYRIFLNDAPFFIKGAGVQKENMETLAAHGANSARTWSTENGQEVLDQAQALGLKVMMGIWVVPERHGFDYNDENAVQKQLERIREKVIEFKDHPALMIWGIGNELNHHATNPKVWDAVNDISEMIHEIDPHHLTTTSLAGISQQDVDHINTLASDLDFISIQVYGSVDILPELVSASTYTGPLLITEWGATGYWEVPKTDWDAPLENNSSVKADLYGKRYEKSIVGQSQQVMGSFVFLWGNKQERTPTWFGMFLPGGNETESVDMMHYAWNGAWPDNRTPRLLDFTLEGQRGADNIRLKAGQSYQAQVIASDPENDALMYRWEMMKESQSDATGGDAEQVPEVIRDAIATGASDTATIRAPTQPGAYRLFVYVADGNNHAAHANLPVWVDE